jgi:hypothetical protein
VIAFSPSGTPDRDPECPTKRIATPHNAQKLGVHRCEDLQKDCDTMISKKDARFVLKMSLNVLEALYVSPFD